MKQSVVRILDFWVSPEIKALEKSEELERARALLFLELLVATFGILGLVGSVIFLYLSPSLASSLIPSAAILRLTICVPGYVLAIWLFKHTGSHALSSNVFACVFYSTILIGALSLSGQALIGGMLYLLALPLLVTLIGNYVTGIVWVVMVAIAPVLLNIVERAGFERIFLINWAALCLGLFIAIYLSHNYLKKMSQHFNVQYTRLEFTAAHDSLTGIANRATFDRRLQESVEFCQLHGTKSVLAYIDLDKFKPINDTYGHQAGDVVLITVADRLCHLARRTDTVARIGGDEFAILFDQCNPESIRPLIERINAVIEEPIHVLGNSLSVGCSIGVVICPDDGVHADQLAHAADQRMYAIKRKAEQH